ncbi:inovirus Gp2 family protein [Azotobacter chroococcum subsp. isscasi]|nr:inovirus Gp2 family protein [Azotobacter chroococcum subsp. isscasi]
MNLNSRVVSMRLRHSDNHNLNLYYGKTFEGFSIQQEKGPFIQEYLQRLHKAMQWTLEDHSRVFAFRIDLRLPVDISLPDYAYTNKVISKFIESFKAKIDHNRDMARRTNKYAHNCKVRYVWAKEIALSGKPHYHLAILLNRDAYRTLGYFASEQSNLFNRLEEAWASALGLPVKAVGGLAHIPDNAIYHLNRDDWRGQDEFFYRASYLCKEATKAYGNRQHAFGTSRG